MKRLLPGRVELLIFGVAALLCAMVAAMTRTVDLTASALAVPVFFGAAMLGMWRGGHLADPSSAAPRQEDGRQVGPCRGGTWPNRWD